LKLDVEFSHKGHFFEFHLVPCGDISDTSQDTFKKFGGYVANAVLQHAELIHVCFFEKSKMEDGGYLGLVKVV